MKKRMQGLICGLLIGGLTVGGAVGAKQLSEMAELYYNNIKIYIDGGEMIPKDANGNVTEPFTVNGTTYLPVRAIAGAFGKEVEWDGATQSIYIGKKDQTKPDNYLDKIQYNDYKEVYGDNNFAIINGTVTDFNNDIHTSGILFYIDYPGAIAEDADNANSTISYPLNSQYKNLKGKIVLPKSYNIATWGKGDNLVTSGTNVWFYGDGKLIYKATSVTSSMPFSFDIDTRGVNQLTIKFKVEHSYSHIALTDLALYK